MAFHWDIDVIPQLEDHVIHVTTLLIAYPLLVHGWRPTRAYNVRPLMLAWNTFQCAFSALVTYHVLPALLSILWNHGYHSSVCMDNRAVAYTTNEYGRWVYYFGISKTWDMVDTVFLKLRGKPVSFLHWYHHWSTLLIVFVQSVVKADMMVWAVTMNAVVHTAMYGHYALTTVRPELRGNRWLTGIQIAQMVAGLSSVTYHALFCNGLMDAPSMLIYTVYVFMFSSFYRQRYSAKRVERIERIEHAE